MQEREARKQGRETRSVPQEETHLGKSAISEVLYGTVTVLAVILVLENHAEGASQVVFAVVGTTWALAFARVYADLIAEILRRGQRFRRSDLQRIWHEVRPVMVYSQLPTLVFILSALGLLPLDLSFEIAQTLGVLVLFAVGYAVGRKVGQSRLRSLLSSFVIAAIGGSIILLKIFTH